MTQLLAFYLGLLAVLTGVFVLVRYLAGKDELVSLRNFFLAGFILFQLTSGIEPLLTQRSGRYLLNDWGGTGLTYSLMATAFLILFLLSYAHGLGSRRLASIVPVTRAAPGVGTLILLAIVLTCFAGVFRFSVNVPLISTIAGKLGVSFAAIASGLVAWVWARRLFNPVIAAIAIAIILANLALMVTGSFGRRNVVAIGGCVLWAMYFSHWRNLPRLAVITRFAIATIPPLLLLMAITSVRSSQERPTFQQQVKSILTQSDLSVGLADLASGQQTVPVSMWLIENYPERFETQHLLGLRYFFAYPVPRAWWSSKPYPLSTQIASTADLDGVSQDVLKIGPGVVGHAAAEGGWYAVFVYAGAMAFFLRFFDQIVLRKVDNPFVVLPVGAAIGQIVGLPRGEISAFAMNYFLGVVFAYIAIISFAKALEYLGWTDPEELFAAVEEGEWDESAEQWYDPSYGAHYEESGDPSDADQA